MLKGFVCLVDGVYICDLLDVVDMIYLDLIIKFGGYVVVVGLFIEVGKFEEFSVVFFCYVGEVLVNIGDLYVIVIDGELIDIELSLDVV